MTATLTIERPDIAVETGGGVVTIESTEKTIGVTVESGGLVPLMADVSLTAGENLSALRMVTTDANGHAVYASNDTMANAQVVGITQTAAAVGDSVSIRTSGLITDAAWSWTKGAVYLGMNGMLTQTAPADGSIVVHVARSLTSTTLQIDIDTIIQTV